MAACLHPSALVQHPARTRTRTLPLPKVWWDVLQQAADDARPRRRASVPLQTNAGSDDQDANLP